MPSRRPRAHRHAVADAVAELEAHAAAHAADLADDLAAGMIPPDAGRPRTSIEVAARVNFAALAAAVDRRHQVLTGALLAARDALAAALEAAMLAGADARPDRPAAGVAELVAHVLDPATDLGAVLDGHAAQVAELRALALAELTGSAADGYREVCAEAAAQGVDPLGAALPPGAPADVVAHALGAELVDDLDRAASTIAVAPSRTALEVLAAALDRTPATGPNVDAAQLAAQLADAVRSARVAGLATDNGRAPLQQAHGRGRQAAAPRIAARLPRPRAPRPVAAAGETDPDAVDLSPPGIVYAYASELLDANTCGPCSLVDGTDYPSLEAAEADYPEGTYYACAGGARCRGTLVYVWGAEAAPTLDTPFGAPTGPGGGPRHDPNTPPGPGPTTPPPPAPETPAQVLGIDDPDGRLDAFTLDELRDARAIANEARAQARAEAEATRGEIEDELGPLGGVRALELRRPPALRQAYRNGRRVHVRDDRFAGGEWDWFYQLSDREQRRLRRDWMAPDLQGPDQFHQSWVDAFPGRTDDVGEVMDEWLERTRRYDQAGALRRGRLPSPAAHSGHVDLGRIAPDTADRWDLWELFDPDEARSLQHVAQRLRDEHTEALARILTRETDQVAPWELTFDQYAEELDYLEAVVPHIEPIDFTPDPWDLDGPGIPVYDPADLADASRLGELAPEGLDDDLEGAAAAAGTTPRRVLYDRIRDAARLLGLLE